LDLDGTLFSGLLEKNLSRRSWSLANFARFLGVVGSEAMVRLDIRIC
jgi:hypothetical protein